MRRDSSSQSGFLVCVADGANLNDAPTRLSLVSWGSSKLARVCRSSSAAEVQAAGKAQEESE